MGHFGVKNTEDVLATHFFWPRIRRDVERFVARCTTCRKAKSRLNPHGLYMPLLFLVFLERIFLWTLFWDCHEHRRGGIVFMLLWIGFLRWHTLFLVIKRMMLHILLICSFVKLFVCMVCQILLSLIVILNFLATFGDVYGLSWGLNCSLVLHVIPKLMVKLK